MLNYRLSQKFKLLGNDEFNHLTISLTISNVIPLKTQKQYSETHMQREQSNKKVQKIKAGRDSSADSQRDYKIQKNKP